MKAAMIAAELAAAGAVDNGAIMRAHAGPVVCCIPVCLYIPTWYRFVQYTLSLIHI